MEKAELERLVVDGLSIAKIGEKIGKGNTTVRYWLNVHGLKTVRTIKALQYNCSCGETDSTRFARGRYTSCKKCRTINQSGRNQKLKKKAVAYKGGACCRCGYNKCLAALDFHHSDPSQKDPNWRAMRNWVFEKIKSELDKCELVCRNCHAEIHYGDEPGGKALALGARKGRFDSCIPDF
jgi:hypothetical protein